MKRRFLLYQIYIAMLKFDFFLFVGFAVQFLVIVNNTQVYERALTIAALPILILLLLLAGYSAQREWIIGTIISLVVYLCAMGYFVFKLIRMWSSSRSVDYEPARKTLTAFAAMTIALLIVTIIVSIRCALNYGHGLKNHTISRNNSVAESTVKDEYYMDPYSQQSQSSAYGMRPPGGSRMEID